MIYVTVGTHQQGFPRLLQALGSLAALDELVVQHGHGPAPREAHVAVAFLPSSAVMANMERARAVVTHAGVGSFLMAREAGHVPVVVPRLRRHGEHVDDHQAQLARALERRDEAIVVWDVADLADAVREASIRRRDAVAATPSVLVTAVRRALDGLGPGPLPAPQERREARVGERVRATPRAPA